MNARKNLQRRKNRRKRGALRRGPRFSYQIDARPEGLGGGFQIRLLESGVEVGGGVFPDWDDAMEEVSLWLASR